MSLLDAAVLGMAKNMTDEEAIKMLEGFIDEFKEAEALNKSKEEKDLAMRHLARACTLVSVRVMTMDQSFGDSLEMITNARADIELGKKMSGRDSVN